MQARIPSYRPGANKAWAISRSAVQLYHGHCQTRYRGSVNQVAVNLYTRPYIWEGQLFYIFIFRHWHSSQDQSEALYAAIVANNALPEKVPRLLKRVIGYEREDNMESKMKRLRIDERTDK